MLKALNYSLGAWVIAIAVSAPSFTIMTAFLLFLGFMNFLVPQLGKD